jgi:dienelactone hydrolase
MTINTSTIAYMDNDVVLEAYIAFDDAIEGQRPAVLVAHAWGGRDEFAAEKAGKLAEMGYVGFALDMYGQGVRGSSIDQNSALMQPFMDDRVMLQKRILAAFYAVKQLPWVDQSHIAAIGFCFGGLCVLDLARSGLNLQGVVSFHGLLTPPESADKNSIKAKVLVLHGNDDPMVPVENVMALQQELTVAGADWQVHTFGQTMHAFTNPVANDPEFGTVYQTNADRRSWQYMQNFLTEIFVG